MLGITSPSRELLFFDQVIKTLDGASKSRLTSDPTYKQLRYISGPLFKELVDDRNLEVHPKRLDVDEVESMISENPRYPKEESRQMSIDCNKRFAGDRIRKSLFLSSSKVGRWSNDSSNFYQVLESLDCLTTVNQVFKNG